MNKYVKLVESCNDEVVTEDTDYSNLSNDELQKRIQNVINYNTPKQPERNMKMSFTVTGPMFGIISPTGHVKSLQELAEKLGLDFSSTGGRNPRISISGPMSLVKKYNEYAENLLGAINNE